MSLKDIIKIVPATINVIGNASDKMADAFNKRIDGVENILELLFKVCKNIIHSVDKMK